jgi:iron complex outermembrane recepter protein
MRVNNAFKRKLLTTSIASCLAAGSALPAAAQTASDQNPGELLEEVIVLGIKQAQATAVDNKRYSASIIDSVSSEDIGKLPDITISDSLQRITGVQIQRSAGEGGKVNIRGLAQVLTTLNGESYLGANSITTVQPDFSDIPSQLFSGADVIKSSQARGSYGGITGAVNLKTYRPFVFDEGLTLSGSTDIQSGTESSETNPSFNGLINWQNGKVGLLGSISYQEKDLANYYSGMAGGGTNAGWAGQVSEGADWPGDVNGDGDANDSFVWYQGHQASNQFTERERLGFNAALQFDIGEGFELVAEYFYTDMENYDRAAGLVHSDKWNRGGWFTPTASTPHSLADGSVLNTVSSYTGNGRRLKSFTTNQYEKSKSQNINIELNFDNGGPFTASARVVKGDADKSRVFTNADIDLANGNQWGVEFQNYPEGQLATNANGYAGFPELTVSGNNWSGFGNNVNLDINGNPIGPVRSASDLLSDISAYGVGNIASEGNFDRDASLDVIRFDGSFEFDNEGFFKSIDAGVRNSSRKAENRQYDYAAPLGENGCLVKWKATDVTLAKDSCQSGANLDDDDPSNDIFYTAGVPMNVQNLGEVVSVSDLGPVNGIPTFFALDPSEMDNGRAFLDRFYPGHVKVTTPGSSYKVDLDELSYYFQANFESGPLSGNIGIRQIDTTLTVVQNVVGNSRDYGVAPLDAGDLVTERDYSDTLPALNVAYNISENLKLRAAYSKTMTPLDLETWGGAFDPDFTFDGDVDSDTFGKFIVTQARESGNPNLDPWRADNYDLSLEYYLGDASLFSVGLFQIEVESFPIKTSEQRALPDADGVVRRSVNVQTITQGDGGTLEGVELSAKVAFSDFVDGGWLSYFGTDVNYTYSPSETGEKDIEGNDLGFPENSEDVFNAVLWFESNQWQARLAYNYRSERVVLLDQAGGLTLMQDETAYVDASVSYDINDNVTVFLNGSNITDESEVFYLQWEDQRAWENTFEPRYTLGIRGSF